MGTGEAELEVYAGEWDHNALRATYVPPNPTAKVRAGDADLQSMIWGSFSIPAAYQEFYIHVSQQKKAEKELSQLP